MEKCNLCPRSCGVDRNSQKGFCQELAKIRVAKIIEHFSWEEPCLSKESGTLAIFFSGCNLKCDYCQNYKISRGGVGEFYTIEEFATLLQEKQKTHSSIDLITPTHFSRQLAEVFTLFKKEVPVIWNTNGYEALENVQMVSKFVDVFLTDIKYSNDSLGAEFSNCPNYFTKTLPAIKEMCHQKEDVFDGEFMKQGVLLRHLVLPGHVKNSLETLDVIAKNFPDRKVSIMSQFTPNGKSKLNRKITAIEYKTVLTHMEKLGLENGYVQDFESATENFVPVFV
ncbi:MAG: 4Fe-4S cluster-binding domain-containing protein [Clostridia bacterium]|nr:4Fe-4S cluster-binding domain-containing protein [Clostridia bacterium]